jgi:ferric-dicitrate binding protein FerR (iron transport regulator)
MKNDADSRWDTDSRLDRQNSFHPDGWSGTADDSNERAAAPRRRGRPRRSWLRTLALPLALCLVLGGAAIYVMIMLTRQA